MNSRTNAARSLLSSLTLLVCITAALAGCKSGGGGASATDIPAAAVAPATSNSVSNPVAATAPPASADPQSANSAPKITGATIPSVTVNSLYTFKPSASDTDGDALAFQIQNKPVWASFNTVTGQLSGTPRLDNTGTFANIVISVNDGKVTTSMPAFSIAVTKPVSNSAALNWVAPTQNVDGSDLNDLAGFTIVYGTSQAALDQTVRIDNASASSYQLENFPSGTYYFAVKAYTAGGVESALSSVVSKAFN